MLFADGIFILKRTRRGVN